MLLPPGVNFISFQTSVMSLHYFFPSKDSQVTILHNKCIQIRHYNQVLFKVQ